MISSSKSQKPPGTTGSQLRNNVSNGIMWESSTYSPVLLSYVEASVCVLSCKWTGLIQKFSTVFSNFLFTVLQTLIKAPFSLSKRFLYNIHTLMNTSRATPLSASYPWLLWQQGIKAPIFWSVIGEHNLLYLLSLSHPVCSPVCPRMKSLAVLLSFIFLNLCTCCKKPFVYSLSEFLYLDPHSTYSEKHWKRALTIMNQ